MVQEERSPALRRRASVSGHVLGSRGLADIDAELEEFSMNAGSAPERICQAHLADQLPNFETHLGPAGSPSRLPAPKGPECSTMPSYNRLRSNDCHLRALLVFAEGSSMRNRHRDRRQHIV